MIRVLIVTAAVALSNVSMAVEAYDLPPVKEDIPFLIDKDTSPLSMVPMQQGPSPITPLGISPAPVVQAASVQTEAKQAVDTSQQWGGILMIFALLALLAAFFLYLLNQVRIFLIHCIIFALNTWFKIQDRMRGYR